MNRRRPPPGLDEADRALWEHVTRSVRPLRPPPPRPRRAALPPPADGAPAASAPSVASPPANRPRAAEAPLAPIEPRLRRRLVRGAVGVDARLDLHGLTQHAAHARLVRFLGEAQRRGHALVLVITGKGAAAGATPHHGEGRGVLRRAVPLWLGLPELRALVVGFEPAGPAHGGAGALYVRIRRRREGSP